MKRIAMTLLIATLGACGVPKNDSGSAILASETSKNASPATMVFAVDLRPVDGDLKEIRLVKNADGKYDATLRVAYFDRLNGHAVDETKEIASGMSCQFAASKVSCRLDLRPVDGDLKVLVIAKSHGSYTATLRTAYFDRIHGRAVDETKVIARQLKLQAQASGQAGNVVFSLDLRPVDGDLKEIRLVKNADGKYDATLRVAYFDRINSQSIDQTSDLASGLACEFSKDASDKLAKVACSVDARPVDGDLKELKIVRNSDGTFNASLRTAFFDRLRNLPVDETKELADGLKMN